MTTRGEIVLERTGGLPPVRLFLGVNEGLALEEQFQTKNAFRFVRDLMIDVIGYRLQKPGPSGEIPECRMRDLRAVVAVMAKKHHPEIDCNEAAGELIDQLTDEAFVDLPLAPVAAIRGQTVESLKAAFQARAQEPEPEEPASPPGEAATSPSPS